LQDVLNDINVLKDDRNLIVHSLWATLMPDNVPLALALRPKAGPNEVVSETFPHERLRRIASDIRAAKNALVGIMRQRDPSRWPTR
jgi:hypothetical protein